jgi:hypothetical protein
MQKACKFLIRVFQINTKCKNNIPFFNFDPDNCNFKFILKWNNRGDIESILSKKKDFSEIIRNMEE